MSESCTQHAYPICDRVSWQGMAARDLNRGSRQWAKKCLPRSSCDPMGRCQTQRPGSLHQQAIVPQITGGIGAGPPYGEGTANTTCTRNHRASACIQPWSPGHGRCDLFHLSRTHPLTSTEGSRRKSLSRWGPAQPPMHRLARVTDASYHKGHQCIITLGSAMHRHSQILHAARTLPILVGVCNLNKCLGGHRGPWQKMQALLR